VLYLGLYSKLTQNSKPQVEVAYEGTGNCLRSIENTLVLMVVTYHHTQHHLPISKVP